LTAPAVRQGQTARQGAIAARASLLAPIAPILALIHLPLLAVPYALEYIRGPGYAIASFACICIVLMISLPRLIASGGIGFRTDAVGVGLFMLLVTGVTSNTIAQLGDRGGDAAILMWQQFGMALSQVLLFYVFRELSQYSDMSRPIMLAFDLVTVLVILSFLAGMAGLARNETYGARQFGVLGDQVAWLLSIAIVVYFARGRWLWFLVALGFLLVTQSRAPLFFAALGIAATLLREPLSVVSLLKRILIVGAAAAIVFLAPDLLSGAADRFRQTDAFYNDRVFTMMYTFDLFREHPLTGGGYNAHQYYFLTRIGPMGMWHMILNTPVSTPLQMLADFGVVGFLFFAVAIVAAIRNASRLTGSSVLWLGPRETDRQFALTGRGLACWLVPFVLLNHSAAYILPLSMLTVMFAAGLGVVTGQAIIARRAVAAARVVRRARRVRPGAQTTSATTAEPSDQAGSA
jgi:O-antigen ligase